MDIIVLKRVKKFKYNITSFYFDMNDNRRISMPRSSSNTQKISEFLEIPKNIKKRQTNITICLSSV